MSQSIPLFSDRFIPPSYLNSPMPILEVCRTRLGEENQYFLDRLNNLAALYESQGRYDQAETTYDRISSSQQQAIK